MKLNLCVLFLFYFTCLIKSQDKKYFPRIEYVSFKNLQFPIEFKVDGSPDIVIVKCPDRQYKHFDSNDTFKPNDNLNNRFVENSEKLKFQYIIQKNELPYKNKINLVCGELTVISETSTRNLNWEYFLEWENKNNLMNDVKTTSISSDFTKMCDECDKIYGRDVSDHIVMSSDKDTYTLFDKNGNNDLYKDNIFYYFRYDKNEKANMVIHPCCKRKLTDGIPSIKIQPNPTESNTEEYIDIYEMSSPTQTFKLSLSPNKNHNYNNFFSKENISMVEMTYKKYELVKKKVTETQIKGEVVIEGYKIIKFYYLCPECDGKNITERVIFFSPPEDKKLVTNPAILDEPSVRPNCSMKAFNFAYLQSVSFEEESATLDELSSSSGTRSGSFVIRNNVVFYTVEGPTGLLTCIYITPDGTYTTETKFKNPPLTTTTEMPKVKEEVKKEEQKSSLSGGWLAVIIIVCLSFVFSLIYFCFLKRKPPTNDLKKVVDNKKFFDKDKINDKKCVKEYSAINLEKSVESSTDSKEKSKEESSKLKLKNPYKMSYGKRSKENNVFKLKSVLNLDPTQCSEKKSLLLSVKEIIQNVVNPKNKIFQSNIKIWYKKFIDCYLKDYSYDIGRERYYPRQISTFRKEVQNKTYNLEHLDLFKPYSKSLIRSENPDKIKMRACDIVVDDIPIDFVMWETGNEYTNGDVWDMFYKENITTVFVFSKEKTSDKCSNLLYWLDEERQIFRNNNIEIKKIVCPFTVKGTLQWCYEIIKDNDLKNSIQVSIVQIDGFDFNDCNSYQLFMGCYDAVFNNHTKGKVLVHSENGLSSYSYMFMYYFHVLANFELKKIKKLYNDYDPMNVIQNICEQMYGEYLTNTEFEHLMHAVWLTLHDKGYIHNDQDRSLIIQNHNEFINFYNKAGVINSTTIPSIIKIFFRLLEGPLMGEERQFTFLCMSSIANSTLFTNIYFGILKSLELIKNLRSKNVICFDNFPIKMDTCFDGKNSGSTFLHGNMIEYVLSNGEKRKIAVCQTPTKHSIKQMFGMIYEYNIGFIGMIIGVNGNDFIEYLPTDDKLMIAGDFTVKRLGVPIKESNNIITTEYSIERKDGETKYFRRCHLVRWEEDGAPNDIDDIFSLKKCIDKYGDKRPMVIYYNHEIERTGAFDFLPSLTDLCPRYGTADVGEFFKLIIKNRALALFNYKLYLFVLNLYAYQNYSLFTGYHRLTFDKVGRKIEGLFSRYLHHKSIMQFYDQKVESFTNKKILVNQAA